MFGWEFPPHHSGGLGVACYGLTRAMTSLGASVLFVMPKKLDVGAPWVKMVFADIPEIAARIINSPVRAYAWNKKYARPEVYGFDLMEEVLRYAQAGREIALEEQFDIIYAHDWLSFGAGVEAKKATGKPLIVHVHATEFDRCAVPAEASAKAGWNKESINEQVYELEKEGMQAADVVIAVSQFTKDLIVREYGIPAEKIRVVHNGIDESTAPTGSGALPRLRQLKHAGYKLVLFLGRITLQKGPDYFVRTAKRVSERNNKVLFVLSGSGDMESQVMDLAARLGISDKVLFTGFVGGHERHEMYAAADLFVMPSVSEPFGLSTLEAMKLGVPVLVSKQSGISEVVRHALKADFWDIDEMANKILSTLKHAPLSSSLSKNGIREADRLTWESAAQKVDSIIHELTA
ncbi:glycosyltransferase family 4 protein [Candidatus Kaiserbacteria bacterium]|nr:glycosyltransferase family 4 protein [Candidatus Kaiserbacteria bacterium]